MLIAPQKSQLVSIRYRCKRQTVLYLTAKYLIIDLEYLYVVKGARGQAYIYELRYGDEVKPGKKFLACLTDIDELRKRFGKSKG